MSTLVNTLVERHAQLLNATFQHLNISLLALLLAAIIAMPLAYWTADHQRTASVLLQVAGVLQTIPSLALLGLLIPLVGIGTVPTIIALVIYALLPIYQNTYIGLTNIDPSLIEAADAFGMTRSKKLVKVQLPLAAPAILGGIRTALVLIIGTATLAALIGAGGLGSFILLGIDRNNVNLILIGALSAALLAIILSSLVAWLARHRWQWTAGLAALLIVGFGANQLFAMTQRTETVTIAGKLGSEPDILINMYKELIEQDNPKIQVQLKSNFGKTTFLFNALKAKDIDIYPEFTGTVLETLVKVPKKQQNEKRTPQQTYSTAKRLLLQQDQLAYLKPMQYENTYALAVPETLAKENQLTKISDLTKIQAKINAGFTLEFLDRPDGYRGIKKAYDLSFKTRSFEPSLRYAAIHDGRVNLVDAFSTDSELVQYHLKVLQDDKHLFPSYRGAPLMTQKFAKEHPGIVKSLNKLAGKISATQMQKMNYAVNVEKKDPATVAHAYLVKHNLLKRGN
ncbi:ABC transporter permease/substrate-binding protein [Liquorilactobacillus satsumensis]|uniref:ABC transporter permease/substrate-binding protein n=1 Tax=Liquorilactobacillus satsumensis TaxID=259059 RepID=UPI001E2C6379|nr:ABC transporter permease/substrate-binding protein [Liquorilactobacillus satsumensis]MCC7666566.1 glycine/betaine ABC transporter permease [Liquorilactobacillus satsumensis]MCP9312034.1 ABC transporter permease/substrate-binding protein [Liquorilactobacillus satsumensis]MCP9357467.1 ABC transporter permease/substrate-binding protein [Liquorilactobacillus satsumensis]MCP9359168.1 ABC transporter permease/substrate-binding protein [Liquorilactobacillus satsumensis]MCP9371295.1 ABC transporter